MPSIVQSSATPPGALLQRAASELETIRDLPKFHGVPFPESCRRLVLSIPGNTNCVDCGAPNPTWASLSYGVLLCLSCSGRHRSYGVKTSFVRSVDMDSWNHSQILTMLEGGNKQLDGFFTRHQMGNSTAICAKRYHTNASKFYRENLSKHVENVSQNGIYRGRDVSRSLSYAGSTSTESATSCGDGSSSESSNGDDDTSINSGERESTVSCECRGRFESSNNDNHPHKSSKSLISNNQLQQVGLITSHQ